MSALPRLDELTGPPVVGRWYMVPHVKQWEMDYPEKSWDVPVRGHAHTDMEIGVSTKHLHFDHRFMTNAMRKVLFNRRTALDGYVVPVEEVRAGGNGSRISDGKIFLKRARCRAHSHWHGIEKWSAKWRMFARTYEGKSLNGDKCPHKGYDMSKVPCDERARKVCPLHGLVFCGLTGRNVPVEELDQ